MSDHNFQRVAEPGGASLYLITAAPFFVDWDRDFLSRDGIHRSQALSCVFMKFPISDLSICLFMAIFVI